MIRLCFVCLGNICRSPTAAGIMAKLVRDSGLQDSIEVASAGTAAYHVGERPDPRALEMARSRGFSLPGRAARFRASDFDRYDYVLAMDASNHADLLSLARNDAERARVHLLRAFDPAAPEGAEVPDPYYGGADGFADVFDICEAACRGLLANLRERHDL